MNSNAHLHCATEAKGGHHVVKLVKRTLISGILYVGLLAGLIVGFIIGLAAGLIGGEESEDIIYQMIAAGLAGAAAGVLTVAACVAGERDIDVRITAFGINSIESFALRIFVIVVVPVVVEVVAKADLGAAVGGISGAFIGNLIARSNKALKSIAKATLFAIALGAIIGTAIGAVGGTIPGIISGAITAGMVTATFDNLEVILKTVLSVGTYSKGFKVVGGIIMTIGMKFIVLGTFIGVILKSTNSMPWSGAVIGAITGSIACRVSFENSDDWSFAFLRQFTNYTVQVFVILMISFIRLCLSGIIILFSEGVYAAANGVIIAASLGVLVSVTQHNRAIFRYRARFAAISGAFGVLYYAMSLLNKPNLNNFSLIEAAASNLEYYDNRSLIVAAVGGAIGGYLVAAVMNTVAIIRFTQAVILLISVMGRALIYIIRLDQPTVLGTIGTTIGAYLGFITDSIVRGRLEGATWGAVFGAITGTAGGVLAVVVTIVIKKMVIPTITLSPGREIKAGIVITAIGGLIGGVIGGHFTSSVEAGGLIGLAFSIAVAASIITAMYIARRHHFKQVILVPLTDIVSNFGTVIVRQESQNDWIQYRITKAPCIEF